jgi:parallel beta-helix repeat protein
MVWLLLAVFSAPAGAKTIYVDDDANGLNDGSSWQNAYKYLQDALMDAKSSTKLVEIRVAQGIYRPDETSAEPNGTGNREATFQLINGVTLKGGYAGFGKPDPNARDSSLYETILSGDIDGDGAFRHWWLSRWQNSYHIVTGSWTYRCAVLDGFIVTAGFANGDSTINSKGAGMHNYCGNPSLINCTFIQNVAEQNGAGMYNYNSDPIVTNCTFSDNWAYSEGYFPNGGGICNIHSNPKVTNCTLSGNVAKGLGGGIYNNCHSNPTIRNCKIDGMAYQGAGITCDGESAPIITNCTLGGFAYFEGGAIYCIGGSSPAITNCVISGTSDEAAGGGLYVAASSPTLINCTISGSQAWGGPGAGLYFGNESSPVVKNCIVWGNVYENTTIEADSAPLITYSDIDFEGEGNIYIDPLFSDSGDYHLKSQAGRWDANEGRWTRDEVTSPCIDAGDPASPIGLEPFPNGGIINMGAYGGTEEASKSYFGEPVCETIVAGDINGDCIVDFKDFAIMALHWLEEH